MKVSHAINVIQVEMMINKLIKILIIFGFLFAQSELNKQVEGTVTYITVENVYCDLGSENGLYIGDTLHVFRSNSEIGLLIVQSTGRKSSVASPLVPVGVLQLGDRVRYTVKPQKDIDESKQEITAKEKTVSPKQKKKRLLDQGGSISIRGNLNRYNGESENLRLLGNVNYRLEIALPIKTQIWIYGHNNFTEKEPRLYQLRMTLGDRNSRFYGQLGRLFVSELAGIGAVDGTMVSYGKSKNKRVGILAGFQPNYLKTEFSTDFKKMGIFSTNKWGKSKRIFKINAALVGQYASDKVDREFIYFRFLWRSGSNIELSWYETVDIYRDSTLYDRSTVEPLSSQISFRYKLGKIFLFNSRLSSRKQILYRQSGAILPDSLFIDELRTGWYNSIQVRTDDWGTLRFSTNLRTQSNTNDLSRMIVLGYTAPRLSKGVYVNVTTSYIKNLIVTGFRNRVSTTKIFKNKGSVFIDYDLYIYGFGNQLVDYSRQTLSFGISYRIMKKISTNLSVDLSKDGEFSSVYIYSGLSLRL